MTPATAPTGPALDQSLLDSDLTPEEVVVVAPGPEKVSVLNEDALDRWESDGGTIPEPSRDPDERRDAPCLPPLPPGCEAQPVWGFRDRTGRLSYEFNHVYGPPEQLDKRGPICRLDEDLSYWAVTWSTASRSGDERSAGRWMSFAQARKLQGSRLTFERFSSLIQMREELPELLLPEGQERERP